MDRSARWLKLLARAGYASRGVVYLIIGIFAFLSAIGPSGRKGSKGALRTLLEQPFGKGLVILMIAGLVGYVAWRLVQSLLDTDDHGWSPKGLAIRGGLLASAATYALLAIYALSLLGLFSGGGDSGDRPVADTIAGYVGLKPVLLALCLTFAGVAIAHWYKAAKRKYADHFDASEKVMRFVHPVSILGLTARGIIWAVLSLLLLFRVMQPAPEGSDPPGMEAALSFIQSLPMGQWLLALMGIGLILFAGYSFSEAIWRRINLEDAG